MSNDPTEPGRFREQAIKLGLDNIIPDFDGKLKIASEHANLLAPSITRFVEVHTMSELGVDLRGTTHDLLHRITEYGLLLHLMFYDSPDRVRLSHIDQQALYSKWAPSTLAAWSATRQYDRDNGGYPFGFFQSLYSGELTAVQKSLGLGWWSRCRNQGKMMNFYCSGILLGMASDVAAQQATVATTSMSRPC